MSLLTPRERRSGLRILLLALAKALGDMIGVAAILPFLAVLGNPEIVRTNPYAAAVYDRFGFDSIDGFLFALGLMLLLLLLLNSLIRSVATYAINRWAFMRGHDLSKRLMESYFRQPYVFFLDRHSAELAGLLLSEVQRVVTYALRPIGDLLSAGLSFAFIGALLFWKEPVVTSFAVAIIGGAYVALFYLLRMRLSGLAEAT